MNTMDHTPDAPTPTPTPMRQYLDRLTWDGTRRLDRIHDELLNYVPVATAREERLREIDGVKAVLQAWFVSAVARARVPGCQVDTALVLVGPQGARKSAFFTALFGDLGTAQIDALGDAAPPPLGTWCVELVEIGDMIRTNALALKAFLASTSDTARLAYAREVTHTLRTSVTVGSTSERVFFNGSIAARRFWPVRVGGPVDYVKTRAWRDQIWAEADALYKAGVPWWTSRSEG